MIARVALSVLGTLILCLPVADLPAAESAAVTTVTVLHYEEQEAGTDPYPVRILISEGHVRIDGGNDADDFILLDRASRRLASVSHEEQNMLMVDYRERDAGVPADLELSERETRDTESPAIQGRQPVNRQYLANGEVCLHAVVVPGLLDEAVAGLADYARVLGMRELGSLQLMPEALRTPCYLSRFVYAPARHLDRGLPVAEWDDRGYRRSLVNFERETHVPATLFRLPPGYDRFSLD